jgi:hypothetical protein
MAPQPLGPPVCCFHVPGESAQSNRDFQLVREVGGDVEDQLRDPGGVGIDLAIAAGHDCHVAGDGAIQGIQGRDRRPSAAVRPQRQVAEAAGRHHGRIEDITLRRGRCSTNAAPHIHRRSQGPAEGLTVAYMACVDYPARRHCIERQSARPGWGEIAVDVDDQVRIVGRVSRNLTSRAGHRNRRVGDDLPKGIVQSGDCRPCLTGGPNRQIAQRSVGHDRKVQ